ncbi:hypothetical protein QFC19_008182 [Naganishia cerealis]|uniref:Uncharacterized protein n=1 Tax=Naganishia cerealis TaxID=610337 RepID=A0ACC2V380_9TREE|nr:hypothetical protein QFC19_008182 [Naganishia cerealis]
MSSYLGGNNAEQQESQESEARDPSATPGPDLKPTISPLPAPPKAKQTTTPSAISVPPSGSTGALIALPSPSRKAMPPPKLMTGLKRKNPGSAVSLQPENEEGRPSKKTAPSPKPKRKARQESQKLH